MFKTLVEKVNKHQIGPLGHHWKVLKWKCPKCPQTFHLNLKCMSYDQKKCWESNWKLDSQPQIPLEQGSNHFQLEHVIHCWKDLFEGYNILPFHAKKRLDLKKIRGSKVLE
jgi:hypothetical protein